MTHLDWIIDSFQTHWSTKYDETADSYIVHKAEILIHLWSQGVEFGQQRVFETPQDFMDCTSHKHLNPHGSHPHRHNRPQKERVGVQLIHDGLKQEGNNSEQILCICILR